MFTRNVTLNLKENSAAEFTRLIEHDVIPVLRKQKGFRDLVTFIAPERSEILTISFWDAKADAEAYSRTGQAEELKTLSKVVNGTSKVETFELSNSTFHKIAAKGA